jgi:hypothetical protein
MQTRCVELPIFGLLGERIREETMVYRLLAVPGVISARVERTNETLQLTFDPSRCGQVQLIEAIEHAMLREM